MACVVDHAHRCLVVRRHQKGDIRTLPPTADAIHFHLFRRLFQLTIYKPAHHDHFKFPRVTNFSREYWHTTNLFQSIRLAHHKKRTEFKSKSVLQNMILCQGIHHTLSRMLALDNKANSHRARTVVQIVIRKRMSLIMTDIIRSHSGIEFQVEIRR